MRTLLVISAVALAAAGLGSSNPGPPACRGSATAAGVVVLPGSAGAGNIVYVLRLRNVSRSSCFVLGLPFLRLLGTTTGPIQPPTRVCEHGSMAVSGLVAGKRARRRPASRTDCAAAAARRR